MQKFILCLAVLTTVFLSFSMSYAQGDGLHLAIKSPSIVLIFEKTPNPAKTLIGTYHLDKEKLKAMKTLGDVIKQNSIEFSTVNEFNDELNFLANNYDKNDTIIVDAPGARCFYFNSYPGLLTYEFQPGDTAYFSYSPPAHSSIPGYLKTIFIFPNELLYCSVLNRVARRYDHTYILIKRGLDGTYFFDSDEVKYQKHIKLLDSLRSEQAISEQCHAFYKKH